AWTVEPSGADTEARVTFTVPEARGTASTVAVIVDGNVAKEMDARGVRDERVGVGTNDGPHSVSLRVCNEFGRCSESDTKTVQAYGALRSEHLMSIQPEQSGTQVRWLVTVDTNGNEATVRVSSPTSGRDVTLGVPGVDVQTVATGWLDLGYSTTEVITVSFFDNNPDRGEVLRQASTTTPDAPPPTVSVGRGAKCNDATGVPTGCGNPVDPCTASNCGAIAVTADGIQPGTTCNLFGGRGNNFRGTVFNLANGTTQTGYSYGTTDPNDMFVTIECNPPKGSRFSATGPWPND
ncbi:MAG: hypothetical protein ABIQ15_04530, partial [Nocardioides sp.]